MWIKLLRLSARRPLAALFVAVLISVASVATIIGVSSQRDDVEAEAKPRMLIGRLWLDRYPDQSRDEVNLFIFFGSGFGIHEYGSRYRAKIDFFEFERQGDTVELTFLHDKKQHKTKFSVKACDDERNFDLCLDLENSPRGPKRYYSWGEEDEDSAQIPWAASWKRAAEERARAQR
jgi:hypothetical protein